MAKGWIREYLAGLLTNPPPGWTANQVRHGRYVGVSLRGAGIPLDLWAHADYIRVGIHTTDPGKVNDLNGIGGFSVGSHAEKWFTGKIHSRGGTAAIDRLLKRPRT